MKTTLMTLTVLLALNGSAWAVAADKADTYPLTTCVVSGEKLGEMGDPVIFNYEGREVRFCCKNCKKDFLKDPAKYLKKIDDASAKKAADTETEAATEKADEDHDHLHK
ncbi:MAG: TRASH domain-containing protein [bacterium]